MSSHNVASRTSVQVADVCGVFQPCVVLPAQHFGRRLGVTPEERLMIAVLSDAIDCVEKYRLAGDHRGQRLFQEVEQWILTREADWPYSFERICDVLSLNSDAVRRQLRLM